MYCLQHIKVHFTFFLLLLILYYLNIYKNYNIKSSKPPAGISFIYTGLLASLEKPDCGHAPAIVHIYRDQTTMPNCTENSTARRLLFPQDKYL